MFDKFQIFVSSLVADTSSNEEMIKNIANIRNYIIGHEYIRKLLSSTYSIFINKDVSDIIGVEYRVNDDDEFI